MAPRTARDHVRKDIQPVHGRRGERRQAATWLTEAVPRARWDRRLRHLRRGDRTCPTGHSPISTELRPAGSESAEPPSSTKHSRRPESDASPQHLRETSSSRARADPRYRTKPAPLTSAGRRTARTTRHSRQLSMRRLQRSPSAASDHVLPDTIAATQETAPPRRERRAATPLRGHGRLEGGACAPPRSASRRRASPRCGPSAPRPSTRRGAGAWPCCRSCRGGRRGAS